VTFVIFDTLIVIKVIYNCKHELQLNRQTDDYAIFKSVFLATKGKGHCAGICLKLQRMSSTKLNYINTPHD